MTAENRQQPSFHDLTAYGRGTRAATAAACGSATLPVIGNLIFVQTFQGRSQGKISLTDRADSPNVPPPENIFQRKEDEVSGGF